MRYENRYESRVAGFDTPCVKEFCRNTRAPGELPHRIEDRRVRKVADAILQNWDCSDMCQEKDEVSGVEIRLVAGRSKCVCFGVADHCIKAWSDVRIERGVSCVV